MDDASRLNHLLESAAHMRLMTMELVLLVLRFARRLIPEQKRWRQMRKNGGMPMGNICLR